MKISQSLIQLSATDLANHLSCPHLTSLSLGATRGEIAEPAWQAPHLAVMRQRGLEHEAAYLDFLKAQGLRVVDLTEATGGAVAQTEAAMRDGADVIYQGGLRDERWGGRTDVLLKVSPGRYEVVDCKLSMETKAETILQLSLYSELLGRVQGARPESFHVIRPETGFAPESYRTAAYAAYTRAVKRSLERAVEAGAATYPEPVPHCDLCRWFSRCDVERRRDDHLSLVAGAGQLHRKELVGREIATLAKLAQTAIDFRPERGSRETYERIQDQARIQYEARVAHERRYKLLPTAPQLGLARLPEPTPGDLYLDFEGDPFVPGGGREYLFGVVNAQSYQSRWAPDRPAEHQAFEWLIDLIEARQREHPQMHVYHFGAYEPAAIKRMMLRYATRVDQVDALLTSERFVDLHAVVKQALRASVEQYSLKDLEPFCGFERTMPLREASQARHRLEHQLERNAAFEDQDAAIVERYNEDDCRATERLHQWLEQLRLQAGIAERPAVKEPKEKKDEEKTRQDAVERIFAALTDGVPDEPSARTDEQAARWLLAHALDWHERERKVSWWEFFRLRDLGEDDLYDERAALAGLRHVERLPKAKPGERVATDRYAYPPQECSFKVDGKLYTSDGEPFGTIRAMDATARTIDVKKTLAAEARHPASVYSHTSFDSKEMAAALLRLGEWTVAQGLEAHGAHQAERDLLLRRKSAAVVAIQGPPGAGKTYTGARMIAQYVREGKRVGVTAVSHKVIDHLLAEVLLADPGIRCAHKDDEHSDERIRLTDKNEQAREWLSNGEAQVLGATAFLWAREEFAGSVDVLVVDEAGQMSLANVLACAQTAKTLVLLGDPQQLEQPQKGSHPEGSDISALGHLLNGARTIGELGQFLEVTWRLHPDLCAFTSEQFYDGRLQAKAGLERQTIEAAPLMQAGLWYAPVPHQGNQTSAPEEIDYIESLVRQVAGGRWINKQGEAAPLGSEQVLIVAPFNDQVDRLRERLPGYRIGTVDKFQGQEAAVVIYSLTASSAEDAPRGLEFLFNLNRFNVATSRARCAVVVVASPQLLAPRCRTPRQMELANALCRFVEAARELPVTPRARPAR